MSLDPIRNFAKVAASTTYNSGATSIVLTSGHGARLPDPSTEGAFNLTWWNSTDYPDPSDDPSVEIVRVTNISEDTLTITRAQEGISASNKNTVGKIYKMILAPTKKTIDDIQKFSISTDQTDFSSQSFQNIIKNGNFESWSSGITYAPDGWVAGSGTTMLADSTNKKMGTYSASITSPNGAQGYIYQSITDLTYYKGRSVTIGGWVKTSTSARVCIYIQDGISYALSPYHTGSGNWELLTIPFAVSNSATELTIFCMVYIAGTPITAYFDGIILVEGSIVPAFSPRPLYDDGKTLTIDSINNRIGIKNATPSQALDIIGNIAVTGTVDGVDISTIPSTYVAKAGDTMSGQLMIRQDSASDINQIDLRNSHGSGYGGSLFFTENAGVPVGKITSHYDGVNWILNLGTNDTDPLITLKNTNVGIGTASPSAQLEIGTNSAFVGQRLRLMGYATTAGTDASIEIGDGSGTYWRMSRDNTNNFRMDLSGTLGILGGNVGIGTATPTQKLQVVGNILVGSGTTGGSPRDPYIDLIDGTWGGHPGCRIKYYGYEQGLQFITLSGNTEPQTESAVHLTIKSDGNVGIGTSSPGGNLEIGTFDTSIKPAIRLRQAGAPAYGFDIDVEEITHGYLAFYSVSNNARTLGLTQSRESGSIGNVGIGTITPLSKLQVDVAKADASNGVDGIYVRNTVAAWTSGTTQSMLTMRDQSEISLGLIKSYKFATGNWGFAFDTYSFGIQTNKLVINGDGNVGIGTVSPFVALTFADNGNNVDRIAINPSSSTTAGDENRIIWGRSDGWTPAAIGQSYGYDGNYGGQLVFFTHPDNGVLGNRTSPLERMRIQANGNVGIGTASPLSALHIKTVGASYDIDVNPFPGITLTPATTNDGNGIRFVGTATNDIVLGQDVTDDSFFIATNSGGAGESTAKRIVVLSSGNVGIGTSAPQKQLHISSGSNTGTVFPLKLSSYGSAVGILFGTGDGYNIIRGKGGIVYEDGGWNRGKIHFLQNTANDETNPALADSVVTIQNDGNVGIGTTSPRTSLQVLSGSENSINLLPTTMLYNSAVSTDIATVIPILGLGTVHGAGAAIGERLRIGFYHPQEGVSSTQVISSSIDAVLQATTFGHNERSDITFNTRITGSSPGDGLTERLRITYDGNVGIGTASPLGLLEVKGGTHSITLVPTSNGNKLDMYLSGSPNYKTIFGATANNIDSSTDWMGISAHYGSKGIVFGTADGTGAIGVMPTVSAKMVIQVGGNVGIGTASPNAKLELYEDNTYGTNAILHVNPHIEGNVSAIRKFVLGTDNNYANYPGVFIGTGTAHHLHFVVNGGSDSGRKMTIDTAGNVGIGTTNPTSLLHSAGSFALPIVNKTGAYTATISDHTITCDASSASFTITLPTAVGISGRIYVIKKVDSSRYAVTIDGNGSETIDGNLTRTTDTQWESVTIQSNNANWIVI